MRIIINNSPSEMEEYVDGVEFDIKDEHVWIQVGRECVRVDKCEFEKVIKVL